MTKQAFNIRLYFFSKNRQSSWIGKSKLCFITGRLGSNLIIYIAYLKNIILENIFTNVVHTLRNLALLIIMLFSGPIRLSASVYWQSVQFKIHCEERAFLVHHCDLRN